MPTRGKSVNQCWREMAASPTERSWCVLKFAPCIAWTPAVSHVGRTSNAFKVTMKLQTFLFQMVVTWCISVQYLWKYGFAKSSDNLYAPYTLRVGNPFSWILGWLSVYTDLDFPVRSFSFIYKFLNVIFRHLDHNPIIPCRNVIFQKNGIVRYTTA
jgi:hypothetical protein